MVGSVSNRKSDRNPNKEINRESIQQVAPFKVSLVYLGMINALYCTHMRICSKIVSLGLKMRAKK